MQQTEYVIDDLVRFIPAQGVLCLVDSSETSVPLSPACNHLLEMFLNSPGVVLAREQILDNFWQETGATPSSNSLNAYVSAIRRGLSSLGVEQEAITTVYKVGFVFNPAISIQKTAIEPAHAAGEPVSAGEPMPADEPISASSPSARRSPRLYWLSGGLILLLVGIFVLPLFLRENTITPINVAQLNGCDVFYLPVHPGESTFPAEPLWRKIIASSGLACQKGGRYMFYADRNVTAGHSGNVYVSYCVKTEDEKIACSNYTELGWRPDNGKE